MFFFYFFFSTEVTFYKVIGVTVSHRRRLAFSRRKVKNGVSRLLSAFNFMLMFEFICVLCLLCLFALPAYYLAHSAHFYIYLGSLGSVCVMRNSNLSLWLRNDGVAKTMIYVRPLIILHTNRNCAHLMCTAIGGRPMHAKCEWRKNMKNDFDHCVNDDDNSHFAAPEMASFAANGANTNHCVIFNI